MKFAARSVNSAASPQTGLVGFIDPSDLIDVYEFIAGGVESIPKNIDHFINTAIFNELVTTVAGGPVGIAVRVTEGGILVASKYFEVPHAQAVAAVVAELQDEVAKSVIYPGYLTEIIFSAVGPAPPHRYVLIRAANGVDVWRLRSTYDP